MDKDKRFVGQPLLSQILELIPGSLLAKAARKHQANRYYKALPLRVHLVSLLYGVFSYCNGLRELCEGMLGCEGKLQHLGLDRSPARSTLSDANSKRSYVVFEMIYESLVKQYHSFISDSRLKGLSIRNLKIIDSTTIQLFSDILQGAGRNPTLGARKKGGIKVHALMDAFSGITEFVRITEARQNDKKFLYELKPVAGSWLVFDRGYTIYQYYSKWSRERVWFVTRMRENADYHVCKVLVDRTKKKKATGVLKDQYITVAEKHGNTYIGRLKLRRIVFRTAEGKEYAFLTNNFKISADQVANIYKNRWMIELLFKQIKQNFPLRYFWGASPNAIKI
jgi:hypothetical protein